MSRRVGGILKAAGLLTGTVVVALAGIGYWIWRGRHRDD